MTVQLLPAEMFRTVVQHAPLVSIDLVLRNGEGEVLLGLRRNRPAQGFWFVPGGRIHKSERIPNAFLRITAEELGLPIPMEEARFLGVFEHHYGDNFSGADFSTHYIVLAYEIELASRSFELPAAQHSDYRWSRPEKALADAETHSYSKAYLEA